MKSKNTRTSKSNKNEYLDGVEPSQLSKNYAFDPNSLKKNFALKVKELITESRIKLKLYQLFDFRLKYNGLIRIDDLLFYINKMSIGTRYKEFYETIYSFNPIRYDSLTISDFLNDDFFKRIPYIRDYFCYSTFPSVFGNFITEECFEKGYQFIKNNFSDANIVPFLVSSFLNHSMLFQDRLISKFIYGVLKLLINKNSEKKKKDDDDDEDENGSNDANANTNAKASANEIPQNWPFENISIQESLNIFMESFQSSLSYLSQYQIKIVKDLWKSNKELAIFCISELFLKDILQSLSKYHTLSDHTNVLTLDCSIINPPNTAYIIHHNLLSEIYNHLDFEKIIQLMCNSQAYFQLAKITDLVFNDGYDLVFSISDLKIIELFHYFMSYEETKEHTIKDSIPQRITKYIANGHQIKPFAKDEFTNESFIITTDFKMFTSTSEAPNAKIDSKDERKVCIETYLVHQFLLQHSGHLHMLQMSTDATKSVVNSKIREYIGEILFKRNVFKPYEYEKSQIVSYSSYLYKNKASFVKNIQIDQKNIPSIMASIYEKVSQKYNNLEPDVLSEKMVEEIVNDINSRSSDKRKLCFVEDDINIQFFTIFLRYLIQVSYRLRIAIYNKKKANRKTGDDFNFEPTVKEAAKKRFVRVDRIVSSLVHKNSMEISEDEYTNFYTGEDENEEFDDDSYDEIQTIIFWSNKAMERDSKFLRSEFNIGQKIQTFVKIEKLITEATKKSDFIVDRPHNKKYLFYKIFKYTRTHLKREKLYTGKVESDNEEEDENEKTFKSRACYYFRANIIKALVYLNKIMKKENKNLLMQVELREANQSLITLSSYFGIKPLQFD